MADPTGDSASITFRARVTNAGNGKTTTTDSVVLGVDNFEVVDGALLLKSGDHARFVVADGNWVHAHVGSAPEQDRA